jgi:hypothetical protein
MGMLIQLGTSVYADAGGKNSGLTEEEALQEVCTFLQNGVEVELKPNETYSVQIPLSNGEFATFECGCTPQLTARESVSGTYTYTATGSYNIWSTVNYDLFGRFKHRATFKITKTSPVCYFSITGEGIDYTQPAPGMEYVASNATHYNYPVGCNSYSDAYCSFKSAVGLTTPIYSRILLNSLNPQKIQYTLYYALTPFN